MSHKTVFWISISNANYSSFGSAFEWETDCSKHKISMPNFGDDM